jgi:tRNA(fMet)-specific endonuclease VapC
MIVLDTDHLSLLLWKGGGESRRLQVRLDGRKNEEVVTTIITYEEQARGWLASLAKARSIEQIVDSYARLKRNLDAFRSLTVLEFDHAAGVIYSKLKDSRIRVGTMDLRIAAIVLSLDGTLLSRNLGDFRKIPDLKVEDWSA